MFENLMKKIDVAAIPVGVSAMVLQLSDPQNPVLAISGKVLIVLAGFFGVMYLAYASYLWFIRRVDFNWHLIHGNFILKVICLVFMMPFTLTLLVSLLCVSPLEFLNEDQTLVETAPSLLWSIYYHFIDPGNQPMASTTLGRGLAAVIALSGVLLLNGLLVSSIIGKLDHLKQRWENGEIRYRLRHLGKNRFAIVIGANEIAASVIKNLFSERNEGEVNFKCEGNNRYVILQTSRKVSKVREELLSHLSEDMMKRVIIYQALRNSEQEMNKLYPEYSTEIYVLGESTLSEGGETAHDSLNMHCVNLIADRLEKTREAREAEKNDTGVNVRRVCKVMFEYQTTSSIFYFSDISEIIKRNLVFIPFNRYESWARKVIVDGFCSEGASRIEYDSLDGGCMGAGSGEFVHFVIVGMSKMGISFGVQAALHAHYPNFEKSRTRITFIDADAKQEERFFKGRYSNLFKLVRTRSIDTAVDGYDVDWCDPFKDPANGYVHLGDGGSNFMDLEIEFLRGEIESDGIRSCLERIVGNPAARVTVAICLPQSHQAVAAALYMPVDVYKSDRLQQVWVYQRESADIILNLTNGSSNDLRYRKLRPFGMLYGEYMDDRARYMKGMLVNVAYEQKSAKCKWPENVSDPYDEGMVHARKKWKNLSVDKKWSNKYFADSMELKLRYAKAGEDLLAKCEHNRWNVQQLLMGYSPCDSELDAIFALQQKEGKSANVLQKYRDWSIRVLHVEKDMEEMSGKKFRIKDDVKESPFRIHPNICSYGHLAEVDPDAYDYDKVLDSAIATIVNLVADK